jgi:hypothetical protein
VIAAVRRSGFAVRHKKTRNRGQVMAAELSPGYNVDNPRGPSVPRRWRDRLRAKVHRLILMRGRGEDTTTLARSVRGSLIYLRQTNPGCAARLQRQLTRASVA